MGGFFLVVTFDTTVKEIKFIYANARSKAICPFAHLATEKGQLSGGAL